jgi:hypothetical protein
MKRRHLLLGAALTGAALLAIFGNRSSDTELAEAVERAPSARAQVQGQAQTQTQTQGKTQAPMPVAAAPLRTVSLPAGAGHAADAGPGGARILALLPREVLIGDGDEQFRQGGNPVFGHQDWTPPPPPPPPAAAASPPPPPSAPPLPFTFIGKSVADGAWEVYLARGDRTYVVRDKTVIDGTYRVDAIAPPVLTLTYLPLNQVQQLNIGVFD